jgi:hypothetical protein
MPESLAHGAVGETLSQAVEHHLGTLVTLLLVHRGQMVQPLSQALGIAQREQDADPFHDFPGTTARGREQRHAGGHGFEQHHAERFVIGAQGKHIEGTEVATSIRHLTEEQHPIADTQFPCQFLEVLFQSTFTENHQLAIGRQLR